MWHGAPTVILLLVDTGGNDEYEAAVGAVGGDESPGPVALAVDLGGDDRYGYPEVGSRWDGSRLPADRDGRSPPGRPGYGPVSLSGQPRQGGARCGSRAAMRRVPSDEHP